MPDRSSFRLVHFIALALVTCMGLTVAIMTGWTVWQLRYGFNEYLQAHDTERLDQFARRLEVMAEKSNGVSVLLQQPWPVVIDQLAGSVNQDRPPDPHAPDRPARFESPHSPPPRPPHEEGLDHRPPPPHRGP